MAKTYKNPPVLEAVCEFRFILENQYSPEQVSAFYSKIKDAFPVSKKGKMHQLQFKIEADKTPEENKQSFNQDFHEFEQYLSEDEKYSVQLDGGRLSIHRIKPYTAWSDFLPRIQNVYRSYVEIFSPKQLMRLGLRYVNEVALPADGFSFADYFTLKASLPSLEENSQKSIFLGSVFEQENGRDAIKVQFAEKQTMGPTPETRAFMLDFDYFLVTPVVAFDAIDAWLEKAHTNLDGVFEGMVTEKTKGLFDK
jgi:uncharacterized protein (TIGR04255 family)